MVVYNSKRTKIRSKWGEKHPESLRTSLQWEALK